MRRSSWEWEDARCKLKMCYQKAIINCNHATQPIIIINLVPLLLPRRRPSRSSLHLQELPFPVQPPCQPPWITWRVPGVVVEGSLHSWDWIASGVTRGATSGGQWKAKGKHMQNDVEERWPRGHLLCSTCKCISGAVPLYIQRKTFTAAVSG